MVFLPRIDHHDAVVVLKGCTDREVKKRKHRQILQSGGLRLGFHAKETLRNGISKIRHKVSLLENIVSEDDGQAVPRDVCRLNP
jgi:hypothetical protein